MSDLTARRPRRETEGDAESCCGGRCCSPKDTRTVDPDLAVRAASTGHVIRAVMTMTNGRTKVQHFASLHSAVKAQERAGERGCSCVLSLCRVVPVGLVDPAVLDDLEGGEVR